MPDVMPSGVHRFSSNMLFALQTMDADAGPAPVVLHYCNCGFDNWVLHYTAHVALHCICRTTLHCTAHVTQPSI